MKKKLVYFVLIIGAIFLGIFITKEKYKEISSLSSKEEQELKMNSNNIYLDTLDETRIASQKNEDSLEDYINSLQENPEQLNQEIALIEKILRDWGSYNSLNLKVGKRYKYFMAYYYLLCNFKSGLDNTLDKGYCQLYNLTYEDGKFKGNMNLLSPEAVKKYDSNTRLDANSIDRYANHIGFEINFFPNYTQLPTDAFKNLVNPANLAGYTRDKFTSKGIEKLKIHYPKTMLDEVELNSVYAVAKSKDKASKLQIIYELYILLFDYELVVNKSDDKVTSYTAFPTSISKDKIKVLFDIAQQNEIDIAEYIDDKSMSPADVYNLFEKLKKRYDIRHPKDGEQFREADKFKDYFLE